MALRAAVAAFLLVVVALAAGRGAALGTANPPPLPPRGKPLPQYQNEYGADWYEEAKEAWEKCISLCKAVKGSYDEDVWAKGPCLSDRHEGQWDIEGWECDVSNWPTKPEVDNEPENNCRRYMSGESRNFAQVMPDCGLLKAV